MLGVFVVEIEWVVMLGADWVLVTLQGLLK
jgi:hypothetical protein